MTRESLIERFGRQSPLAGSDDESPQLVLDTESTSKFRKRFLYSSFMVLVVVVVLDISWSFNGHWYFDVFHMFHGGSCETLMNLSPILQINFGVGILTKKN